MAVSVTATRQESSQSRWGRVDFSNELASVKEDSPQAQGQTTATDKVGAVVIWERESVLRGWLKG